MTALLFIFTWYNLPFTFLLGVCLVLSALQLIGLGGDHEGGADAHADLDHDLDIEHGVDLDHGVDLSHDLDHDLSHDLDQDLDHDIDHDLSHDLGHEAEHGADHEAGQGAAAQTEGGFSFLSVLAFLGMGKAPLMVVLLVFFGSMSILGWLLNGLVVSLFGGSYPGLAFVGVMLVVLVLGVVVTSRVALFIARTLPPLVTTASRAEALVGRTGTVISPEVSESYGQVHLRDPGGTLITVFAVIRAEAPIPRGEEVVTVSYETEQKRYLVTRSKRVSTTLVDPQ